jgi:uncharacterized membrane protein YcaP (DUF421 family)
MAFRTVAMYAFLLFCMRLAGKRELGQVSPFDLVVAVLVGELAAIPLEGHKIPLISGIVPIATIVVVQLATAYLSLKSEKVRAFLSGKPTVLISGGKIMERSLYRARYNLNDLMANLRLKGAANIGDVEYAILEDTGSLSVILKSQKRPLTPSDMSIPTGYEGMTFTLILDGQVDYGALVEAGLDYTWLSDQLKELGYQGPDEVLLGVLPTGGQPIFYRIQSRNS